ncbi:unnamed protein product [Microthlaspi erraticum]|uniref:F-box domain-containing protein n=1 Tax=Microthlaspi erraticum TaxID=1685480 RepID=A0A6D2HQ11_9BRAS|nr:unnamed protein product [Microthlaspi erraticum]
MEVEKLPWELEVEILSRVPPLSLVRFRTVCKRWQTLFNDKMFINNHLAHSRPQFILCTKSQIYSACIHDLDGNDPSIKMRKLVLDYPNFMLPKKIVYCDGFLLCISDQGVAVWNPWLRQTRWLDYHESCGIRKYGILYDIKSNGYKILRYVIDLDACLANRKIQIYEIASNAWKVVNVEDTLKENLIYLSNSVSLNGTLYYIAFTYEDSCWYSIRRFTCATEKFDTLCRLPCKNVRENTRVLALFKRDRLSVLEQCDATNEIVVWVTKENIKNEDDEAVLWVKFMTVSISIPKLYHKNYNFICDPCYFIDDTDDKRLVVCFGDQFGQACIYIVKGHELKKIKIDPMVESLTNVCAYIPSLVPILGQI